MGKKDKPRVEVTRNRFTVNQDNSTIYEYFREVFLPSGIRVSIPTKIGASPCYSHGPDSPMQPVCKNRLLIDGLGVESAQLQKEISEMKALSGRDPSSGIDFGQLVLVKEAIMASNRDGIEKAKSGTVNPEVVVYAQGPGPNPACVKALETIQK